MLNISSEKQTKSFFFGVDQGVFNLEETQKLIQDIIGEIYCPGRYSSQQKCAFFHTCTTEDESCYNYLQSKACCHVLNMPFRDHKPTISLFGVDGTFCHINNKGRDYKKEKPFLFGELSRPMTISYTQTCTKKGKKLCIYIVIVSIHHWLTQLTKYSFTFPFYTLSVRSQAIGFSQSPTTVLSNLSTLDKIQLL